MDVSVTRRITGPIRRARERRRGRSEERVAQRLAAQWAQARAERRRAEAEPATIESGPSNVRRAEVPWGVDLAAAWSWRLLVISAAGVALLWVIGHFAVVTVPLGIALLVTALAAPLVGLAGRVGINRKLASIVAVVGGLALIGLLLTFVGRQVAQGFSDLSQQVVDGLDEIRQWLRTGPLNASDTQINDAIQQVQSAVTSGNQQVVTRITEVGTAVSHIVAGFFIVLFASFFFLSDGSRIWAWMVRLFPRAARARVDSSGRVAWRSLTQFVRATVLVALVDAIGIMIVAAVLQVPFVTAIGVLVFLGAFIPLVGATLSGAVAVLVALVSHGFIVALLMLAGVLGVQQLEAHVLQPFLMGRFVAVHPLGVIVAIAVGVLVAGIAGALVAVPLVAALNAVVQHLASQPRVEEDPGEGPGRQVGAEQ